MYETFDLRVLKSGKIQGYQWHLDDPDKVICIVHGIGEYGGRFDRVVEVFRSRNMAVVSMDLRGHGNSIEKKGHCAPRKDVLEDVSCLMEYATEKYPGEPLILYGHSMGGNIVLDYRGRGRLNDVPAGYIISAPWIRLVRPIPSVFYWAIKLLSKVAPTITSGSNVDEKTLGHPQSVKPYSTNPMVHNRISALCAVDGFEVGKALETGKQENNGKADAIPALLMHGSADKICSVEGSRKAAKLMDERGEAVTYIEWPGLFHEIHNGNAENKGDEVIETMTAWAAAL